MFKDTLHTDVHAGEMALMGGITLYMTTAAQHAANYKRGQQRSACHGHLPSASQGKPGAIT